MTRLILPHAYIDGVVRDLVTRYAPEDWEIVPVYTDPDVPTAYHDAVCAEWERPGDLVIVEQDIAVGPETFAQYEACPEWMCTSLTWAAGRVQPTTGCVRFRGELKAHHPDLVDAARMVDDATDMPPGDWRRIDVRVYGAARARGVLLHAHDPQVLHLHDYTKPRRTA